MTSRAQALDGPVDRAPLGQGPLRIPLLILHPKLSQVRADVVQDDIEPKLKAVAVAVVPQQPLGGADQGVDVGLLVAPLQAGLFIRRGPGKDLLRLHPVGVPVLPVQGGGNVPDIVTLITVAWELDGLAAQFQVAQPHGGAQDVHLAAGVVDVILPMDLIAHRCQQVGHRRSIGRAAPVADMQGTGGVGGDEFHLNTLAGTESGATIIGPGAENGRDHCQVSVPGKKKVDEARPGNLHPGNQGRGRKGGHQALRDLARLGADGLGQDQGQVGGKIAVGLVPGTFDLRLRKCDGAPGPISSQVRQTGTQEVRYLLFHESFGWREDRGRGPGDAPRVGV